MSTIEEQRADFLRSSNKSWMSTSHRLNTLVPVCLSTVCGEQLEFTRAPLLTMAICSQ